MSQLTRSQRLALWQDRFDRFAQANVTVAEFCRREAVSVPNFYHWKKKLAIPPTRKPKLNTGPTGTNRFVSVVVNAAPLTTKMHLPGGAAIELPAELPRRQLIDLISAVIDVTDAAVRPAENA
jgi:hypothetical protein